MTATVVPCPVCAAMEPAPEGGRNLDARAGPEVVVVAAMEPAPEDGRNLAAGDSVPAVRAAAMEPAP